MKGAIVAVVAAFVTSCFVPPGVAALVAYGGRAGGRAALLGLVLPVLSAMFWSAGCLFQVLDSMLGRGI
jgi:hypothetical protein